MRVPPDTPILTTDAMRAAEADAEAAGTSLATLMDRAGAAVADMAWRIAANAPILVLVGPGNNGGDGYVAARLLGQRGANVRVAASGPPCTDLARAARAAWDGPVEALTAKTHPAPIVVDALFGVGLSRGLDDPLMTALGSLEKKAARIIAVDLPSGIDGDTGQLLSKPLRADITIALGALKPAHVLLPGADWCGQTICADLGPSIKADLRSLARGHVSAESAPATNKFRKGMVMVRSGPMTGAAGLAAGGALRAGAGYVLLTNAARAPCLAIICEADDQFATRLADPRLGAVVIGPGSVVNRELEKHIGRILAADVPAVLDAAALDIAVPELMALSVPRPIILTPHAGEFDRVFPDLTGSKIARTCEAARRTGAVVVHKGADMIIAAPDGRVSAAWPGSPWLATAGSGDVLAGACGAMLARGMEAFDAAIAACRWHIAAARRIGPALIADDLLERHDL